MKAVCIIFPTNAECLRLYVFNLFNVESAAQSQLLIDLEPA